jgi:class 3 adenylate cyclase/tetratricopeptide (TPR) repeat protein
MVFCDLTGSTALGEKMDPESLRHVITRYFEEMKQALARHGGTVEKFIGDAVMAVFGVPTVREDDALRAVRAADEMQDSMRAMNEDLELEWGVALQARIGVHTGEVIAGDPSSGHGFVSGDAVNVAARLEQAAAPGTIFISDSTHRLVRDAVEVEAVEPLELKGKSEPMPAYRLVDVVPHLLGVSRRLDSTLVGRDEEMMAIGAAFEGAIESRACKLVTVFGAAGMGKSRLTQEFMTRASAKARILDGRCLPYGEGITYWPVAEIIRTASGIDASSPPDQARNQLAQTFESLPGAETVLPRLEAILGLSDSNPDTQEIFWAIRKVVEFAATERPLLLVIDDIHWAESTLLDLIEYLPEFVTDAPITLLCLARGELRDARPNWGSTGTVITLEPLVEEDVRLLITNLLGQADIPTELRDRVITAAEGNPLYVDELLKMLIDDGTLIQQEGKWTGRGELTQLAIPPTIQALVEARLDRVPNEERAIAQRAAVVGKEFWWGAVSDLSPESTRPDIPRNLMGLVRKELILPERSTFADEDAFRFAHIMIRDAAYAGLAKESRADLHERFASWLENKARERVVEHEEILAFHLEQAARLYAELGSSDPKIETLRARALDLLERSGRRAYARGDMPAAHSLLKRAIDLLPIKDVRRTELSIMLGDVLLELGDFAGVERVSGEVERVANATGDPRAGAWGTLLRSEVESQTDFSDWQEIGATQLDSLIEVFTQHGDELGLARTHLLKAVSSWDSYRATDANASLEASLHHAARVGEQSHEEARALSGLAAVLLWGPEPVDRALERCRETIEHARDLLVLRGNNLLRLGALEAMAGRYEEARRLAQEGKHVLADLGQTLMLAASAQETGFIEILAGDYESAEQELLQSVQELDELGANAYLSMSAVHLGIVLCELGRFDDAYRYAELSERVLEEKIDETEWGTRCVRARVAISRGDLATASELGFEATRLTKDVEIVWIRGYALETAGEVLRAAGEGEEAKKAYGKALELYEAKGIVAFIEKMQARLAELS